MQEKEVVEVEEALVEWRTELEAEAALVAAEREAAAVEKLAAQVGRRL